MLLACFVLSICSVAFGQNISSISQARTLIKQQTIELKDARTEIANLKISLNNANTKISEGKNEIQSVEKRAKDLHDWGVSRQKEAEKYFGEYNKAVDKYHRSKLINCITAAIIGLVFGAWLMRIIPAEAKVYGVPVSIICPIASPIICGLLVWFLL